MENTALNIQARATVTEQTQAPRQRCLTTVKLQWLAERLRKTERIKAAIADGTYRIETQNVAKALLWMDN